MGRPIHYKVLFLATEKEFSRGGGTVITTCTPCACEKMRKKGCFSRSGDVRAYSEKGIKIAKIRKKGYTLNVKLT